MPENPFAISFEKADLRLLRVEEVSSRLRVSRAFVRLCIAAGCPTRKGRLSAAGLLGWLFGHYNEVRELAGFARFAEVHGVAPLPAWRLRMANAILTLLQFAETRAFVPEQKEQLREVQRFVERALEHA